MDAPATLHLPGQGHSLWITDSLAPVGTLSLPGAGFSIWIESDVIPSTTVSLTPRAVQLPGRGTSVWINESFAQSSPPAPSGSGALSLPGHGHSLWTPANLVVNPATLAVSQNGGSTPDVGISLPGDGFSVWTATTLASSIPTGGPVHLPGNSYTLWTQPYRTASPHPSSSQKPSLIANTMKLFGFAQCVGVLLIIALLFGYLGSRDEADNLKSALAEEEKEHRAAREEGQGYHDQVIALEKKVKASVEKEAVLSNEIDTLAKAKTGIENTMKTQLANLEKANAAVGQAKAEVEAKLKEVAEAGEAKEAELSQTIAQAKNQLAKSQAEAVKLQTSVDELAKAKADVDAKLKESAEALRQAKGELDVLNAQLDEAEKSKSDLHKEMDALRKSLEAKEKEAKEAEDDTKDANKEVSALSRENLRLKGALKSSNEKFIEIRNFVDQSQPVQQDNTIASGTAILEADLLRQLDKERKDRQAIAEILKELRSKVEEIQSDVTAAQTADL